MGKIIIYPTCPRCGSIKTGDLKPRSTYNFKKELQDVEKAMQKGQYIQYVDPVKWRDYNIPMDVKFYCTDCGAMFRGETKIISFSYNDVKSYHEDMGFYDALENIHYKKKNPMMQALKKWLPFCHFKKEKEEEDLDVQSIH